MKNFFSLFHFKELRILLSLEAIIIILTLLISYQQNTEIDFNLSAAIASLVCWTLASFIDPKNYFNFFTLLATGIFGYGVFWILFEILKPLLTTF